MKNKPNWLILHHTAGTEKDSLASTKHHTFEIVNDWHRQNPKVWLGKYSSLGFAIGYHYFIDINGKLTQGRLDTDEGAHCRGMNTSSIGIGLAGNFNRPNERPNQDQKDSLKKLLLELMKKWNIPEKRIVPHRRFSLKNCYGKNLQDDWAFKLVSLDVVEKKVLLLKLQSLLKTLLALLQEYRAKVINKRT